MDQDISQKETYFVAVKIFLEHKDKLLILKDNFGCWDLPGGRIKKEEFYASLDQVIKRKMNEEIGSSLRYTVEKMPSIFMRHERKEAVEGNPLVRIFALGYQAEFQEGEIALSPRHTEYQWVDLKTFNPESYFTGGWLKGIQEYVKTKNG